MAADAGAEPAPDARPDVGPAAASDPPINAPITVPATAPAGGYAPTELLRRPDASWTEIFRGPFEVSQLFSMPTANVVGAYQLRLYGDASLLSERDVLSTSSVAALGFGDLAQLEYRQSTAVSHRVRTQRELLGLPAIGVQFEVPLRERRYVPRFGVALRFGLPCDQRGEPVSGAVTRPSYDERATDLYLVASLPLRKASLHLGTRITSASLVSTGQTAATDLERTLILPAAGAAFAVTAHSAMIVEASMIPRFELPSADGPGAISSDPYARAGVRWSALPWLTVDASIGYHLELQRKSVPPSSGVESLVDWDIRIGGELALPWGAVLCRSMGVFCS